MGMATPLSYNTLGPTFDATRGLPPGVGIALVAAVRAMTGVEPGARMIEPGVGTGRIATPFVAAGYEVWGIDISRPMLTACRAKLRATECTDDSWCLVQADVRALPFPPDTFDLALTASVLYLVSDWPRALAELRRVLRPGGSYVAITEASVSNAALSAFDAKWRELLGETRDQGASIPIPDTAMTRWFAARGATINEARVTNWRREHTIGETLATYAERVRPLYPSLSTTDFAAAMALLAAWAAGTFATDREPLVCDIALNLSHAKMPPTSA